MTVFSVFSESTSLHPDGAMPSWPSPHAAGLLPPGVLPGSFLLTLPLVAGSLPLRRCHCPARNLQSPHSLRLKLSLGSQFSPGPQLLQLPPSLTGLRSHEPPCFSANTGDPPQSCLSSPFFPLLGMMFCKLLPRCGHHIFRLLLRGHLLSEV